MSACGSVMRDTSPQGRFVCALARGHSGQHSATFDVDGVAYWTDAGAVQSRAWTEKEWAAGPDALSELRAENTRLRALLAARSPAPSEETFCESCERRVETLQETIRALNEAEADRDAANNRAERFADDVARLLLQSRAAPILEEREADDEYDEASAVALQVLCRVFEDGADVAMEEWREWYKPEQWLWHARGLGAFIASRLAEKRELTADERGAFERLQAAMHLVSGKSKPVEITMRDANCLVHAIASPPRAAPSEGAREVETTITMEAPS